MNLSLVRIAEITGAQADKFDPNAIAIGYSIDSRTLRPGELFFAVKGEKLDGHDFVPQALENGAVAAVVAREKLSFFELGATGAPARPLLAVDDTLIALQSLATALRRLWVKPL